MARKNESQEGSKAAAPKAKPAAEAKAVAKRAPSKAEVAEFDDLTNLAQETRVLEDEVRLQSGGNFNWVKVLQSGTDFVTKGTEGYIKGAEAGDYLVVVNGKNVVKETLRVTPVGMFKVYAEKKPSAKPSEMDQTVKFWHTDDAEQMPLVDGDNFRRRLANGNYLMPMHWLFVYIHEFPEIKDALIPFQSIGNSYYAKIMKLVKANSQLASELILDLKTDGQKNEDFNKTYFYPIAEVVGKNFSIDPETGKVVPAKGVPADKIREILTLSNELNKQFKESKLVTRQAPGQLTALSGAAGAPVARRGLPGATGGAGYASDEEGEPPKF